MSRTGTIPGAGRSKAAASRRGFCGSGETLSVEKKTFTKKDRIRDKLDFDRLKKCGTKFTDGVFLAVILPNDTGFSRLGIAVPKRVGSAVARNRMKRLIREAFRLNRDSLPGSVDLLIIVRRSPDLMTLGEFSARILSRGPVCTGQTGGGIGAGRRTYVKMILLRLKAVIVLSTA